jgi:hypothetical protein
MIANEEKKSTNEEVRSVPLNLNQFIGASQLSVMRTACRGEEGEHFKALIENLKMQIASMPKTYETDGMGNDAPVTLHYFRGGSDWYIVERDIEAEQLQAFGFACLNGDHDNAEFGYINIEELIKYGVELDLYYTPETIGQIKDRFQKAS